MEQDETQPVQLPAAPFPAPPPFWKHFTTDNRERLNALEVDKDDSTPLPIDLVFLKPPPPSSETAKTFTVFSIPQSLSVVPAAPPSDLLLFDPESPSFNPASLLTRLTKSLLLNFLELVTILGNDPTQYAEKLSDVNRLMLNAHFVINMYRPHQARERVKEMLEDRLEDCKTEIQRSDDMIVKVKEYLKSLEQNSHGTDSVRDGDATAEKSGKDAENNMKLWSLIETLDND